MTSPTVSIVLINWNGREHLTRCLPSITAQTYRDYEIIVVDNGSTDGSVSYVRDSYPAVRLILNDHNAGFACANNQGISVATGRYVVVLNNDTWVGPDWLESLVTSAESRPEMGAFACLVKFDDRRDMIDSAGLTVSVLGHGCQNHLGDAADGIIEAKEVFGVSATAAMFRRELLDDVGLFDEDYFIYYEDVDLAWRARLLGWRSILVPAAVVYHIHSATVGRGSPFKKRLLTRNRMWTIVKDYHVPTLLFFLPFICTFEVGAALLSLAKGDTAPLVGLRQGIAGIRAALRKRAQIQAAKRMPFRHLAPLMHWFRSPVSAFQHHRRVGRL
jgi:GT2 family glycosyltransferase